VSGATPDETLLVKLATGTVIAAFTVIVWVYAELLPAAFVAVSEAV
jgi:hypothetical protein